MIEPQKQIRGHLAALFTISVWGITFVSTKVLLATFTPGEITFYRLVLAVLALLILSPPHLPRRALDRQELLDELRFMAAGLCGVTLFFLFQNIALTYTLAANVSVLVSVAPLFTALVSRLLLNEKLKANFFLGFAAAITGIILIAFNGSLVLKLNPIGELLAILAALSWAFYNVAIRKVSPERSGVFYLTRKVFTYGLLLSLPFLQLFDFHLGLERLLVLPNLLNLLFLGVVASALCYVSWNYAVQLLGPTKTSVYIYLVPVVTIVFSALVLHETITSVAGIGMALILVGIALSERGKAS
jgi:drug/metabolite transporter (DMT)-like permease